MSLQCLHCSKQFNTQPALNWHIQKDKTCMATRKNNKSIQPQLVRSAGNRNNAQANAGNRNNAQANAGNRNNAQANVGTRNNAQANAGNRNNTQANVSNRNNAQANAGNQIKSEISAPIRLNNLENNSPLTSLDIANKSAQLSQPRANKETSSNQTRINKVAPLVPPRTLPQKEPPTIVQFSTNNQVFLADSTRVENSSNIIPSINTTENMPSVPPKKTRSVSKTNIPINLDTPAEILLSQINILKEANSKLAQDKLALIDENDTLKNKVIKQDAELHQWKDKLISNKQKLVGEDLKNELITLILDSDLNIQEISDDIERDIYGFIIDKLVANQSIFKKIFVCCK